MVRIGARRSDFHVFQVSAMVDSSSGVMRKPTCVGFGIRIDVARDSKLVLTIKAVSKGSCQH